MSYTELPEKSFFHVDIANKSQNVNSLGTLNLRSQGGALW